MCRYADFKLSLEKLDSRSASHSSLPIVYQWEQQLSGRMSRCDFVCVLFNLSKVMLANFMSK